jgi:hypothetical protein
LDDDQKEKYSNAFKLALQFRNDELSSKSWSHSRGILSS